MKEVKIYYGISGTFKTSTIESELHKNTDCIAMWSGIKLWKYYDSGIFNGLIPYSDLNYAILHLVRLKGITQDYRNADKELLVERGISDMLFYWIRKQEDQEKISTGWIGNVIKEENVIVDSAGKVEKILLIQKDQDFIRDVIIGGRRGEFFPGGVQDYLEQQERYVEFTRKYNEISREIVITDAKQYITKDLDIEFKEQ